MTVGPSANAARLAEAQAFLLAGASQHPVDAREPTAAGPGPDSETLRAAYLDLLKLCLCDLAGPSTLSAGALTDGTVMAHELRGDERRLRVAGLDWPLHGLTMIGLRRLDDLQGCVESVVADGVAGDLIEAGAWRGGASLLMRATLDVLGEGRTVCVADSFAGFPADGDAEAAEKGLDAIGVLAAPLAEVRETFARFGCVRGVEFLPGFFADTLPALAGRRWAVVRLDADTYEPTRHALKWLYPSLEPGGYLIVDDYGIFEGCRRAVDDFRAEHGIDEPLETVDRWCVRWRRVSDAEVPAPAPPGIGPPPPPPPAPAGPPEPVHVPTVREADLADEVVALRERLAAAEADVARLNSRGWLRR
jgi:hypothetical protein